MKTPRSYPDVPTADAEDPVIAGITIVSSRDAGGHNIWRFKINRGDEDLAINSLLDWLGSNRQFSLADRSVSDHESLVSFEMNGLDYVMSLGGHGWSGGKKILDRELAFAKAKSESKHNYGPPFSDLGYLDEKKPRGFWDWLFVERFTAGSTFPHRHCF